MGLTNLKSLILLSFLFLSDSASAVPVDGLFIGQQPDDGPENMIPGAEMFSKIIPAGFGGRIPHTWPTQPNQTPARDLPEKSNGSGRKRDFKTNSMGHWEIHSPNAGVSAMQCQLLPNNKVIMYDATSLGPSGIELQPKGNCRPVPNSKRGEIDCWAHAVEYDIETGKVRPLKLLTDAWCSSGGVTPDGKLMSTGGFKDGGNGVRILDTCPTCDFEENPRGLAKPRWYSTQEKLEDGSFVIFGGRREFNYEIVQPLLNFPQKNVPFQFLNDTTDIFENNLYPFAYLLPDGNIFLFANNRAVILDVYSNRVVRELPELPGGARNYPPSGMSALLPLRIDPNDPTSPVDTEVIVCGGNAPDSMDQAEKKHTFLPALKDCGRIAPLQPDAKWEIEMMPSPRTMGDTLLLPSGEVLIINGAMEGVSGWNLADKPNFTPVLYNPRSPSGRRFKELKPSQIARMYHSSSAVLPDGKVLVAGSNTNPRYMYKDAKYPTELRVEKFSPPYLDPKLDKYRPVIVPQNAALLVLYSQEFELEMSNIKGRLKHYEVTLLSPPFTTHGYSQNQRLVVLKPVEVTKTSIRVQAPPDGRITPPGYYILSVVYRGVPSKGIWVQIH